MSWIWDMFQQHQIRDNQQRSTDAQLDAKSAHKEIAQLQEKIDALSLLCRALFEELQIVSGITESQLRQRMAEIDLRDGKLDGKYDPKAIETCSECGHKIKNNRSNCFWCGAKLTREK